MSNLIPIRQHIEMDENEDGVFVAARRVWVTTPDGRLCDGDGPTIVPPPPVPEHASMMPCMIPTEDQVRQLVATCPDTVAALADRARRIVEGED